MNDDWPLVRVDELLEASIGGVWGSDPGESDVDVTVFRSTDFNADGHLSLEKGARRSVTTSQLASRQMRHGDVLLEKSGGGPNQPVGRVAYVEGAVPEPSVCANFIQFLRPDTNRVVCKYLFYALWADHSNNVTLQYQAQTTGIRNLRTKDYLARQIAVPPLPVQRRIVDLMAHLDNHQSLLVSERARLAGFLSTLRRSKWDQMSDFCVPLGDHLSGITAGRSPDTTGERPLINEPGVLKVNSVDPSGEFLVREAKALPQGHSMSKHWELVGGEVLVTRANTAERVAAVAQVPLDIRGGLFLCDKTLRLDFDESGAHPAFVAEMLLAPQAREQVSSMATGVGSSMVNISQSKLRSWILPMPSLETQVSVARQMRTIRELTRSLDNESTALNRLKSQLLSRLLDGSIILDQAYDDVLEVA